MKKLKQSTLQLFLLTVMGLLFITGTIAQTSNINTDTAQRLDEYVAALNKLGPFSGSVLLAKNGQVVASKGFGLANQEYDVPNTPQTKFRIGSITKQFTAIAVMILQERGKLNVQDPICKYLADCPESWQSITLHQLLTHTSGIPNFVTLPEYKEIAMQPSAPDEIIQKFKNKPLDFKPGEKFNYSNSGYIVLGRIIEKASGEKYKDFLRKNIFEPLKMNNTGYDHYQAVLKNRAEGYVWRNGFSRDRYIDMSVPYAAGGLYSTVEDLFLWDQALYTDKLISKKSLAAIFTPVKENYGYGWLMGSLFNHQNESHSGSIEGFKSIIARYPNEKASVIILSNIGNVNLSGMTRDFAAMVFGEKYELPKAPLPPKERVVAAIKIDSKILDIYVGQYEFPMFVLNVTKEGDRLMAQPSSGGPKAELIPESETKFFIREEEGSQFVFASDGSKVTHIEATLRGQQFKGKKIK